MQYPALRPENEVNLPSGESTPGLKRRVWQSICENRVGVGVAVFIFAITLAHVSPASVALNYFDPPKRFLWSALACWLALEAFFSKRPVSKGPFLSLLAILLWIGGRCLARDNYGIELEVLASWLLPGVLFGLGLTVDRDRVIKPVAWTLLLSGVIQGVVMCLQYIGKDPLFPETTLAFTRLTHRMIGTIGNQNQAADVLALSGVALVFLIRNPLIRLPLFCVMLAVVFLTGCRGAMLGFVGALLAAEGFAILFTLRKRSRRALLRLTVVIVFLLAVIAGLFVSMPRTRERFVEIIGNPAQNRTVNFRATMAKITWSMWSEKPVIGWGAGAFAFQYLDRLENECPRVKEWEALAQIKFVREAHNDYLQFAAEFGLVGLALVSCLLFLILQRIWALRVERSRVATSCFYILVYFSITSLVSFPWQTAIAGPFGALLLGILLRHNTSENDSKNSFQAWIPGFIYLLFSAGLLAWNSMEAHYNLVVPRELQEGEAAQLAKRVPPYLYKYHAMIGASLACESAYPEALSELQLAYRGYRDPLLYNNLGNVLSKMGRWPDAVTIYSKWVSCGLEYPAAMENLSVAYEQAGYIRQAAQIGDKQIRFVDCDDEAPIMRVMALYLQSGNTPEALRVLEWYEAHPTVEHNSGSAEYDNLVGAVYLSAGNDVAAEERFRSALRKNPDLLSAKRNLQQFLQGKERSDPRPGN